MNSTYQVHRLFWSALDWVYPPSCAGCGKTGYRFCADCLNSLTLLHGNLCPICGRQIAENYIVCRQCAINPYYFTSACSWAAYDGTLREAIHAMKYHHDLGLGDYFAAFLISLIEQKNWQFDLVLPVPLSKMRMKSRGFNQSALLSRPIARYFGVEHSTAMLAREKETDPQYSKTTVEREMNLQDAFSANPAKLNGRRVLLVDDIITTGATIKYCSKALSEAGAESILVISLAKALRKTYDFGKTP